VILDSRAYHTPFFILSHTGDFGNYPERLRLCHLPLSNTTLSPSAEKTQPAACNIVHFGHQGDIVVHTNTELTITIAVLISIRCNLSFLGSLIAVTPIIGLSNETTGMGAGVSIVTPRLCQAFRHYQKPHLRCLNT
jgi:hypothetical protein